MLIRFGFLFCCFLVAFSKQRFRVCIQVLNYSLSLILQCYLFVMTSVCVPYYWVTSRQGFIKWTFLWVISCELVTWNHAYIFYCLHSFLDLIFLVSPFLKRRGLVSLAFLYNCIPQIYASFSVPFTFLSPSLLYQFYIKVTLIELGIIM